MHPLLKELESIQIRKVAYHRMIENNPESTECPVWEQRLKQLREDEAFVLAKMKGVPGVSAAGFFSPNINNAKKFQQ